MQSRLLWRHCNGHVANSTVVIRNYMPSYIVYIIAYNSLKSLLVELIYISKNQSGNSTVFWQFIRAIIKEIIKTPQHWCFPVLPKFGFPLQRTCNRESVPMSWRHHGWPWCVMRQTVSFLLPGVKRSWTCCVSNPLETLLINSPNNLSSIQFTLRLYELYLSDELVIYTSL